MNPLFLLIPNSALCEAVLEQINADKLGTAQNVETVQSFLKQAEKIHDPLLIIDESAIDKRNSDAISSVQDHARKPTLLLLGISDIEGITESFTKPLRLGHLISRIGYYLKTAPLLRERMVRFGSYYLEPQSRRVVSAVDNNPVRLTEKETALLVFLAQNDTAVTRRDILANVWGYDERIDTHTLETHLYQLRRKLEGEWLIAENGGYRLAQDETR